MIFSEKLTLIRKNKGFSQEKLAEKLFVSRQAVAKWESGHTYPDITNLIELSRIFNVTVDYLVKDEECIKNPKTENFNDKELLKFISTASKATYAGYGNESEPSRPLSHDLRYEEDQYLYIDSYVGGENFSGTEVVWEKGEPIFSMNYCGRVVGENFSGDFLKTVLRNAPVEKPFRGPKFYSEGNFSYTCKIDGDISWFQGYEEILLGEERIYECYFHGGLVK